MNSIRKNIKDILELLASKQKQLKYEKDVPIADVPAELICMWFDDSYHPNSQQHRKAFTNEEQNILRSFNTFYDSRIDLLPKTLSKMHSDPVWNEVVKEAQEVLKAIRW